MQASEARAQSVPARDCTLAIAGRVRERLEKMCGGMLPVSEVEICNAINAELRLDTVSRPHAGPLTSEREAELREKPAHYCVHELFPVLDQARAEQETTKRYYTAYCTALQTICNLLDAEPGAQHIDQVAVACVERSQADLRRIARACDLPEDAIPGRIHEEVARLTTLNGRARATIHQIADALGLVERADGTDGYRQASDDRIVNEVTELVRARRDAVDMSIQQSQQLDRVADVLGQECEPSEVDVAAITAVSAIRAELRDERESGRTLGKGYGRIRAELEKTRAEYEALRTGVSTVATALADAANSNDSIARKYKDEAGRLHYISRADVLRGCESKLRVLLSPSLPLSESAKRLDGGWQHTSSDGDAHSFRHADGAERTLEGFATWQEAEPFIGDPEQPCGAPWPAPVPASLAPLAPLTARVERLEGALRTLDDMLRAYVMPDSVAEAHKALEALDANAHGGG